MPRNVYAPIVLTLNALLTTVGCQSNDQRLADFAAWAATEQARQNDRMAEQSQAVSRHSQELAAAAHELVQQDAEARRDLILAQEKLQEQIHVERLGVDRQREELHADRKSLAAAAYREPLIAQAIMTIGLMLAALLPLLVTAYALRRLPETEGVAQLLEDAFAELALSQGDVNERPNLTTQGAARIGQAPGE